MKLLLEIEYIAEILNFIFRKTFQLNTCLESPEQRLTMTCWYVFFRCKLL